MPIAECRHICYFTLPESSPGSGQDPHFTVEKMKAQSHEIDSRFFSKLVIMEGLKLAFIFYLTFLIEEPLGMVHATTQSPV